MGKFSDYFLESDDERNLQLVCLIYIQWKS